MDGEVFVVLVLVLGEFVVRKAKAAETYLKTLACSDPDKQRALEFLYQKFATKC